MKLIANNYYLEIAELEQQPIGHFIGGDPNFDLNYRGPALEEYKRMQKRLDEHPDWIRPKYLNYLIKKNKLIVSECVNAQYFPMGKRIGKTYDEFEDRVFVTVGYSLKFKGKQMTVAEFENWAAKNPQPPMKKNEWRKQKKQ